MNASTATADTPLRQADCAFHADGRAGSPLLTSMYWFKYTSVSRGSACPSRRFRHEPSWTMWAFDAKARVCYHRKAVKGDITITRFSVQW